MKSKKINKKLELKKETISTLEIVNMAMPKGGAILTSPRTICTVPDICNTGEDGCTLWCSMHCA